MAERDNPADQALRSRKARDGAMILPVMGLLLLTPPVADMFAISGRIFGIPVLVAYIFAVWGLLIAFACLLARMGQRVEEEENRQRVRQGRGHVDGTGP